MRTTKIRCSEVPLWLVGSEFHNNLNSDEPDTDIEVPSDCFLGDPEVLCLEDLVDVVKVMRFWCVRAIPQNVLEFCFSNEASVSQLAETVGEGNLEHIALKTAFQDKQRFSLEAALQTSRPEMVSFWLTKIGPCSRLGENAIAQACRFGRLDLVETLREKGFPWDSYAYCAAAQYGHLHVLKYLRSQNCSLEFEAQQFAARGGHLHCMKYLHGIGCEWDMCVTKEFAVPQHFGTITSQYCPWTDDWSIPPPVGGYLECLQYALENDCPVHPSACSIASGYGLLDCLMLLHQHGGTLQAWCTTDAAAAGHLDCLIYLHENGCSWNKYTAASAAANGHLNCLQYLHQQGCDWNAECFESAASSGSLESIRYLHENRCPRSHAVMHIITSHGHLDCLQYLHSQGYVWDKKATHNAALGGHLTCLQYMHQHYSPWDATVTSAAAFSGHLDCLQYLHTHGCPWDTDTTLWAAEQGHYDCLSYAIEHRCPYDENDVLIAAAQSGCIKSLKYMVETQGVKISDSAAFAEAFCRTHFECVQYLIDHGSPYEDFFFTRVSGACDDNNLLQCIQYAMHRGWKANTNLLNYVVENNFTQCIAFLQANGWKTALHKNI